MNHIKKILILALGGEGGGTLTEWLVEAGLAAGWPIQATSIPGVAQRTGGTSYYIECLPRPLAAGEAAPPMCLAPLAGDLDLILSSELLETARAVERGLPSPKRTRIISGRGVHKFFEAFALCLADVCEGGMNLFERGGAAERAAMNWVIQHVPEKTRKKI